MTLTLPIVVGKKYVRRDGVAITARPSRGGYFKDTIFVGREGENEIMSPRTLVWSFDGLVSRGSPGSVMDLVADYIEPAKGHPHAALMMEFAKDAQETATPLDRWEQRASQSGEYVWVPVEMYQLWHPAGVYRRKPTITPDPHAESAAEYAKDMAVSDKAWERWETCMRENGKWFNLHGHPDWFQSHDYRRKRDSL